MTMPEIDSDKRNALRRSTLKGGKIVFNAGRSTIDCTVRNLSATGAKLQVNSVVGIPDTFDRANQEAPGPMWHCTQVTRECGPSWYAANSGCITE